MFYSSVNEGGWHKGAAVWVTCSTKNTGRDYSRCKRKQLLSVAFSEYLFKTTWLLVVDIGPPLPKRSPKRQVQLSEYVLHLPLVVSKNCSFTSFCFSCSTCKHHFNPHPTKYILPNFLLEHKFLCLCNEKRYRADLR